MRTDLEFLERAKSFGLECSGIIYDNRACLRMKPIVDLRVVRITALIHGVGEDQLELYYDNVPPTHPELSVQFGDELCVSSTLRLRKGYAKAWLQLMGVDLSKVEVVSVQHGKLDGFPDD